MRIAKLDLSGHLNAVLRGMPISIQSQVILPFGRLDMPQFEPSAVTVSDARMIFRAHADDLQPHDDPIDTAEEICEMLRDRCGLERSHEHLFLSLYFHRVIENLKSGATLESALLPLPKAQLFSTDAQKFIRVDFAFWTGRRFICVLISESRMEQERSAEETLLKLWGFEVFRLMAEDLETRGFMGGTGAKMLEALEVHEV